VIPEQLEIEAFGPFVAKQSLDFAKAGARGLFLIHGPTGSGKSTILDAMTFALYGETSGNDRDGADLVSTLAEGAEARVTLAFQHAGVRYRVTRTPRQTRRKVRGDGTREAAPTATLSRLAGGREEILEDKPMNVTRRICELLHCDARQFRQTVVLPQGQFRRVVEDDDTRERALAELFGTARFDEVQARLKAYAKRLRSEVRSLLEEQGGIAEEHEVKTTADLEGRVEAARERASAAEAAAREADATLTAAIEELAQARGVMAQFEELAGVRERRDRLEGEQREVDAERDRLEADRRAQLAAPAVAAMAEAERERARRAAALEEAAEALEGATSRHQAAGAALAELDAEAETVTRQREARARLEGLLPVVEHVEALEKAAHDASTTAATARAEAERLETKRHTLQGDLDGARAELARLDAALADEAAATEADRSTRQRLDAFDAATEARTALSALAHDGGVVRLDGLWDPLLRAAATRLAPGAPCPVCGSPEHPAALDVHDRPAALDGLQEALRSVQAEAASVAAARARHEERLERALEAGRWEVGTLPSREELAAEAAAALERARLASDARRDHAAHSTTASELDNRLRETDGLLTAARPHLAAAEAEATRTATRLEAAKERLGSDFGGAEAFHAELDRTRQVVDAFDTLLRERSDAARTAGTALEVAAGKADVARTELERAEDRRRETSDEAHAALREHGFVTADGSASVAAFEAARMSADHRAASDRRVREHEGSLASARARVAELEALLATAERPDLDALGTARGERERTRDEAFDARTAAVQVRDDVTAALRRWRALERELGDREARARTAAQLSDLVNGTATGQLRLDLRTFVLKRIMRSVLAHANVHLARMTGGRYQLRLREAGEELRAHGLGLDVEDRHAGGARRRVATLSGGEGFQASLALALGLSETAQRTSGAVELGALFIDEGFGSLDAHALDEVVKILRELPSVEGRMVGVITHVEDLKRRIDAQVLVTRDDVGSRLAVSGTS
jgi:DNA repair protein SbcC/Rad50